MAAWLLQRQALRAVLASVENFARSSAERSKISVDDMIVITHNLASLLITDQRERQSD
ncbi:hypothetical protein [Pelomonas sp. KK5]|uniref:hypothetical protein n=1 Tax=Pelomonas sp. KK5 TaxID=1855730 RepID=UPI001301C67F|nr:hypothetical protein [Pelomonas sp. KK5]